MNLTNNKIIIVHVKDLYLIIDRHLHHHHLLVVGVVETVAHGILDHLQQENEVKVLRQ